MGATRVDSVVSMDGVGSAKFSRTVVLSTTSMDVIPFNGPAYGPGVSRTDSRLTLTASASNGLPSWKVTPSRKVSTSRGLTHG